MGKWLMRLGALVLAVTVLIVTGCPPKGADEGGKEPVAKTPQPPIPASPEPKPVEKKPIPIDVETTLDTMTPEPAIPETKLPESDRAKCLVWIGDPLPSGELASVDGEKANLAELLGKKGTVVLFWNAGDSEISQKMAAQNLADLQADVQELYGDQGLAVIAINPKDPPEKIKELLGTTQVAYPVLLDNGGGLFAKVASEGLPRVYLLDSAGKILWLDIEFSEVTRETLKRSAPAVVGAAK